MLEHLHRCPQEREETYTWEGATVTRCIDCGAQHVHDRSEPPDNSGVRFEPLPDPSYREVML
jgi:hypothetical protein